MFYILIDVTNVVHFANIEHKHVNAFQSYIVIITAIHPMHLEALMDEIDVIQHK